MWLAFILFGCGDGALACRCEEAELCVAMRDEADPDADFARCEPVPDACGPGLDCDDNTCVRAAFDLCDPGFEGALCEQDAEDVPALTCYAGP